MIFNRYVLVLVAGYQSISSASAERNLKGHKEHGKPQNRLLNSEYDALVSLLNEKYENSCSVYVTGKLPATPSTFVDCRRSGGFATLTAEGGSDPVPKRLKVCGYGANMKEKCHHIRFSGDEKKDLDKAKTLIDGHGSARQLSEFKVGPTFYEEIVDLVNKLFDHHCQVVTTGFGKAETFVSCVMPGSTVHFTSAGTPAGGDPVPLELELCSYGDEMKETCKKLSFTSGVKEDIKEVEHFLKGGARSLSTETTPIVGTDYQMLVQLLNGVFDDACHVYVTGAGHHEPRTSVVCNRDGGDAILSAVGAAEPKPKALQVCGYGAEMVQTCNSIALTGETTSDLPAAKKLLGVRD